MPRQQKDNEDDNQIEKKHSRASPEVQSKQVNEYFSTAVSDQQINWALTTKNTNSQKLKKTKITEKN